jgi:putative ABC transport system permease protein
MTIYEGICYAFFAALATLAAGLPIAVIAARKFSEMTFHGVIMPYSFPFLQMGQFVR